MFLLTMIVLTWYLKGVSAAWTQRFRALAALSCAKRCCSSESQHFAVIRVDTHGNRFIVKQDMLLSDAKALEKHFDSMTHHQGYYIVPQGRAQEEVTKGEAEKGH